MTIQRCIKTIVNFLLSNKRFPGLLILLDNYCKFVAGNLLKIQHGQNRSWKKRLSSSSFDTHINSLVFSNEREVIFKIIPSGKKYNRGDLCNHGLCTQGD